MKYIRTKDGIINAEKRFEHLLKCKTKQEFNKNQKKGLMSIYISEEWKTIYVYSHSGFYMIEHITQADTIEELCDEFVLIHTEYDNSKDIFESYGGQAKHRGDSYYDFSFEQIRTGRRIIKGTLYGAVWTEWGLKYVAKMNDKGELELL